MSYEEAKQKLLILLDHCLLVSIELRVSNFFILPSNVQCMILGIIGPNKVPQLTEEEFKDRKIKLSEFAKILAKTDFEILLTPDKKSLLEFFGKEYLKNGGKKIYEIVPLEDDYEQHLNIKLGEIISCGMWPNQPSKFNEECDVIFCVGYGGMVLAEMGFSGYYNPKTIYIITDFISAELPKELGLKIEYVSLKNVNQILKKIN